MKRLLQNQFCLFVLALAVNLVFQQGLFAQGVTTSSLSGTVTDASGEPLIGANVVAIHLPSGTTYGTSTDIDGTFNIANMRVGGPYKITSSYTGYGDNVVEGIVLRLGEAQRRNIVLEEQAIELMGIQVVATRGATGANAGSSTQITSEDLDVLPTLDRDLNDFTRLTPQASTSVSGISFAGVNNRYNAIYIDGAVNNDVFGLSSSGTNGGQTGISPISVDVIDQIQVVLSPYDVTLGGFAGGGINAVTKSGTNTFSGTAYYFIKNQDLAGKT
ncbi:MAG: carboxypeptidase regulatory-like domain-containing protein, partial [Saprospiraceae bacterium]|nr:carboxypeptidase regulatory-like domain-containing protein [Saprospiraceae bacterium]